MHSLPLARTITRLQRLETMLPAKRCDEIACAVTLLIENALTAHYAYERQRPIASLPSLYPTAP
jgi:hypothetical protein